MRPLLLTFSLMFIYCISAAPLAAQNDLLGEINFPNSGNEAAQEDFYEGVLFLHNFEYADAARAFRSAQEADPGFALAYWGEAMTHNHPIWMQQYRGEAMEILNKLGESVGERQESAPTQREKDYLMAVEILYGNTAESQGKSKEERDILYSDYLKQLQQKYPDDHEITAFYGLSILGTAHEGRDFGIYMRAAAELFKVWNQNQKHPGAAHYLIHSFDDPDHAPLGLPMARAYSEIAPRAAHAQHMTSHIFLALGIWEDVIDANLVARDVQTARQRELNEKTTVCGHYPWWLQYGYLQNGEAGKASEILDRCHERVKNSAERMEKWHFSVMLGHQIADTERWQEASKYSRDFSSDSNAAINYHFITAFAALNQGDTEEAQKVLSMLKQTPDSEQRNIQILQLEGLLEIESGNEEEGLVILQKAVQEESELPVDFGPPTIVKPSRELLGDLLLKMGRYSEALEAYEAQLERTPNRQRSVIGKESATELLAAN